MPNAFDPQDGPRKTTPGWSIGSVTLPHIMWPAFAILGLAAGLIGSRQFSNHGRFDPWIGVLWWLISALVVLLWIREKWSKPEFSKFAGMVVVGSVMMSATFFLTRKLGL